MKGASMTPEESAEATRGVVVPLVVIGLTVAWFMTTPAPPPQAPIMSEVEMQHHSRALLRNQLSAHAAKLERLRQDLIATPHDGSGTWERIKADVDQTRAACFKALSRYDILLHSQGREMYSRASPYVCR
jgi:uncharacterized protein YPO0396